MDLVKVVTLALLRALGNFGGGLLAEVLQATGRRLNLALHGAAGIMLAVIGVELIPLSARRRPATADRIGLHAGWRSRRADQGARAVAERAPRWCGRDPCLDDQYRGSRGSV